MNIIGVILSLIFMLSGIVIWPTKADNNTEDEKINRYVFAGVLFVFAILFFFVGYKGK